MLLSEEAFTTLVDAGCRACDGKRLVVESIVAQRQPLLGGEPYGSPSWAYKGEDLVRGTFRITCDGCKEALFTSDACPACATPGRIGIALESENTFPLPSSCGGCGSELVTAEAYVPASVVYEGRRAAKARTQTVPEDPGFHAFRISCKECGATTVRRTPCPLCGG